MRLRYYPNTDSLYIELNPRPSGETLEIAQDVARRLFMW